MNTMRAAMLVVAAILAACGGDDGPEPECRGNDPVCANPGLAATFDAEVERCEAGEPVWSPSCGEAAVSCYDRAAMRDLPSPVCEDGSAPSCVDICPDILAAR